MAFLRCLTCFTTDLCILRWLGVTELGLNFGLWLWTKILILFEAILVQILVWFLLRCVVPIKVLCVVVMMVLSVELSLLLLMMMILNLVLHLDLMLIVIRCRVVVSACLGLFAGVHS